MRVAEVIQLLNTPLRISKITWKIPGLFDMSFEPKDVLTAMQTADLVEDILNEWFIKRQVMWLDIRHEDPEESRDSLKEISKELSKVVKNQSSRWRKQDAVIPSFLRQWSSACATTSKALHREIQGMVKNNAAQLNSDEYIDPSWFMPKILVEFRKATYPSVEALIQMLPDSSPFRKTVADKWEEGRDILKSHEGRDDLYGNWGYKLKKVKKK